MAQDRYPKRLIEYDLPIGPISVNAAAEMEKRRGHIPMMHIWWAHRPPVACRALLLASLLPNPNDPNCPESFVIEAKSIIQNYFSSISTKSINLDNTAAIRDALLGLVGNVSQYELRADPSLINTCKQLVTAANRDTQLLLYDPFSGGGIIPFEGARLGINTMSSDSNPCAVLLNKIVLEYIPKYGHTLADEVEKWANTFHNRLREKLKEFYPAVVPGESPVSYLWARTARCEGPGCGIEIPLLKQLWISRKGKATAAFHLSIHQDTKRVDVDIITNPKPTEVGKGTIKGASLTCPRCGFTTPASSVRAQLSTRRGGNEDARMLAVVATSKTSKGRQYRLPTDKDRAAVQNAEKFFSSQIGNLPVPDEDLPGKDKHRAVGSQLPLWGFKVWSDLFLTRQLLALSTLSEMISESYYEISHAVKDEELAKAISANMALLLDKMADMNTSLCVWQTHAEIPAHLFGRKALPMVTDFAEAVPISTSSGSLVSGLARSIRVLREYSNLPLKAATATCNDASCLPVPDSAVSVYFTDPPYYDSVPYADLSDFFYVWLKRSIGHLFPELFNSPLTDKSQEATVNHPKDEEEKKRYLHLLTQAWVEARRVVSPDGIAIIVFAHKSTSGWEALLESILAAGWKITASWPIDTEMKSRMNAKGTASLTSSVHLVCRPRVNTVVSLPADDVGDWRDVLNELPPRIHEWMPRLAQEGIVGADAIFACLGPALEIFSRYSSVEKASGEKVTLKDYLEQVWAAVAREALTMIFEGADASGFEEDARLTAMWLWTLRTSANGNDKNKSAEENEDEEAEGKSKKTTGYDLEYDAARKIAQGLGAYLEKLGHLVEVKGDIATLLSAGARTKYLFGKEATEAPKPKRKKEGRQLSLDLGEELKEVEAESGIWPGDLHATPGRTILDQLHQSMILFGAGRGEALKRFLVDDGIGINPLFWRLAQSLTALYPTGTDEKRWVEGVLARKKGLGF